MKHILLAVLIISVLSGCVTLDMQSYVGKDIRNVMLDHGPSVHQYNMGHGVKAYQWEMINRYREPVTASTTGYVPINKSGIVSANTIYTGGGAHISKCFYTFLTKWNELTKMWVITGFRQPVSGC